MKRPDRLFACDGVIFNPVPDSLYCGTHPLMFKYKPKHHQTCDFLVRVVTSSSKLGWSNTFASIEHRDANLELWMMGDERKPILFTAVLCADDRPKDNEIWEFGKERGEWVAVKLRADKRQPNFKDTILSTLTCLADSFDIADMF